MKEFLSLSEAVVPLHIVFHQDPFVPFLGRDLCFLGSSVQVSILPNIARSPKAGVSGYIAVVLVIIMLLLPIYGLGCFPFSIKCVCFGEVILLCSTAAEHTSFPDGVRSIMNRLIERLSWVNWSTSE